MRVSLVAPDFKAASGGLGRNVPRLARALRGLGISVELCAVGHETENVANDGHTFLGVPSGPRIVGRSPELRRRLLEAPSDLFHANGLWMAPLGYAAEAAFRQNVPLVVSPRGMLSPWALRRSRWKKTLARVFIHPGAFRRTSGWHVTSSAEEADVRRLGFAQPICVAPNGVDPSGEDPVAVRAVYERLAPEIAGKRVLLFYSRFHSKKRLVELIKDFAALAPSRPEWHLLAVGIPEELSVETLRSCAVASGIGSRVSVLDGRDLPKPYLVAEVMALPTHNENFGQVVGEALAAGIAVITTTGTPWQDLNEQGAGRWVPISEFRSALGEVLALRPDELKAAGERGRLWVLSRFSWNASASTLSRFYERLVAGQPGRR